MVNAFLVNICYQFYAKPITAHSHCLMALYCRDGGTQTQTVLKAYYSQVVRFQTVSHPTPRPQPSVCSHTLTFSLVGTAHQPNINVMLNQALTTSAPHCSRTYWTCAVCGLCYCFPAIGYLMTAKSHLPNGNISGEVSQCFRCVGYRGF